MEIAVKSPEILDTPAIQEIKKEAEAVIEQPVAEQTSIPTQSPEIPAAKVSALSLASIRAKKELEQQSKSIARETIQHLSEPFTETEMTLFWTKYAERLGEKGYKIIESLLLNNDPVLKGTTITVELSSDGAKIEFEKELNGLLSYLRGHLHNHDIVIELIVNEQKPTKKTFNAKERYDRLKEINPTLELLKSTFGLELD